MEAIWRPVPSLPAYEASSLGQLRHVPYRQKMPNGGEKTVVGKPFVGIWDRRWKRFVMHCSTGYLQIDQLVCEAFHGARPYERARPIHSDGDIRNNAASNLSWPSMAMRPRPPERSEHKLLASLARAGTSVETLATVFGMQIDDCRWLLTRLRKRRVNTAAVSAQGEYGRLSISDASGIIEMPNALSPVSASARYFPHAQPPRRQAAGGNAA